MTTAELIGCVIFAALFAATTHIVHLLTTRGEVAKRHAGRFASAFVGFGALIGLLAAFFVNPGHSIFAVIGGVLAGWSVARRLGLADSVVVSTTGRSNPSFDLLNPYSPSSTAGSSDDSDDGSPYRAPEPGLRSFTNEQSTFPPQ